MLPVCGEAQLLNLLNLLVNRGSRVERGGGFRQMSVIVVSYSNVIYEYFYKSILYGLGQF